MTSTDGRRRRLPATEEATFTTSRFRIIIPHPGEPEPEPEIHDIPRSVAKYEGPLAKCNKICTRMRKVTSIANDFEKERLNVKVRTLNKEQTIIVNKRNSESQPFQKSLQELRGYQTALSRKRMGASGSGNMLSRSLPDMSGLRREDTCLSANLPPYGRYEGVAIRELREDIKRLVEENHPRAKRIRHAHQLMETNKKKSLLARPEILESKLNDIVTRPWAEFKLIPKYQKKEEKNGDPSKIKGGGISGPAMVEQSNKGYGNFFTSANQAFIFN